MEYSLILSTNRKNVTLCANNEADFSQYHYHADGGSQIRPPVTLCSRGLRVQPWFVQIAVTATTTQSWPFPSDPSSTARGRLNDSVNLINAENRTRLFPFWTSVSICWSLSCVCSLYLACAPALDLLGNRLLHTHICKSALSVGVLGCKVSLRLSGDSREHFLIFLGLAL